MEISKNLLVDWVIPAPQTKNLKIAKEILLIFSFAFFTAICAKIKIEIGIVPITAQTLGVLLSGALLGSLRGTLSQFLYLLLGLFGAPFFARGEGISYIFSPTFGYIVGFVFCTYIVGYLAERGWTKNYFLTFLAFILGNFFLYIPGLFYLASFVGFEKVFQIGLLPFIPGDLFKILLATYLLPTLWKIFPSK